MNVTTTAASPAAAVQTPPAPAVPDAKPRVGINDRAAALRDKLDAEPQASEPAVEGDQPRASTPSAADSEAAKPADDAAAQRYAERQARLKAVREKDEANDAERARKQQAKARDTEMEQLRKRVAELEPNEAVWKSPAALLEMAEKKGLTSTQVVEELRARLTDPAAIAAREAQTIEQKMQARIDALEAKLEAEKVQRENETKAERQQREQIAKASTFSAQVAASKDTHPRTAALLARKGEQNFIHFLNEAIIEPHMNEGYTLEQLHDSTEQFLDWIHDLGDAAPAPAANEGASQAKKNGAAKPVTTLSDSLTSERTQVTEDKPLHLLSKKEREARLRAKLDRE